MSEMVKHGIEKANKELIKENEEKLMQEVIFHFFTIFWVYFNSFRQVIKKEKTTILNILN